MAEVVISEVGPRDGLQAIESTVPTTVKIAWIKALVQAGVREIEVGSFVSAKRVPQLADTAEVVAAVRELPHLKVMALVANLRGAEAALSAGVHQLSLPLSVSRAHSLANVGKTPQHMLEQLAAVIELVRQHNRQHHGAVGVEVGLSTAFGCTLQGPVAEAEVFALAEACARCGADQVGLSDTTGMANPRQVKAYFTQLQRQLGTRAGAAHLHNTRGLGLANVLAAFEAGVRTFDSSQGGLGGCPYAPGASGNVVSEDVVFMFEAMGVSTGIDWSALVAARRHLEQALPQQPLYGMSVAAGLPLGWGQSAT